MSSELIDTLTRIIQKTADELEQTGPHEPVEHRRDLRAEIKELLDLRNHKSIFHDVGESPPHPFEMISKVDT